VAPFTNAPVCERRAGNWNSHRSDPLVNCGVERVFADSPKQEKPRLEFLPTTGRDTLHSRNATDCRIERKAIQ